MKYKKKKTGTILLFVLLQKIFHSSILPFFYLTVPRMPNEASNFTTDKRPKTPKIAPRRNPKDTIESSHSYQGIPSFHQLSRYANERTPFGSLYLPKQDAGWIFRYICTLDYFVVSRVLANLEQAKGKGRAEGNAGSDVA